MRASDGLLLVGVVVGAAVAASGIVEAEPGAGELPVDSVATVDGRPILRRDYERAVDAVAATRRAPVDAGLKRRILRRLVEEELLVQGALDLGVAERDPRVRADLGAAMIDLLVARVDARGERTEVELRAAYEAHPERWQAPGRVEVRVAFFGQEAAVRAAKGRIRAGEAFAEATASAGEPPAPVPEEPMPVGRLSAYLGPSAAALAAETPAGGTTAPITMAGGWALIHTVAREDAGHRPFESVRDLVAAELRREDGDRELRRFLDERRSAVPVVIAEDRL